MVTSTLTVRIRQPHPEQERFISGTAKRKVIRAGRRSGKTFGIAILAVQSFLAGKRVLYAAPTGEQLERFWFEVSRALNETVRAGVYRKNETEHFIEREGTENRLRAKTAWNANTLRGDYADLLILDEFQLMAEDTWSEVGAPMLLDNDGDAVFIYTPASLRSSGVSKAQDPRHAARLYQSAHDDKTGRWEAFHFTSYDNPYLPAAGLEEITKDMTQEAHRREILAEEDDLQQGQLVYGNFRELTQVKVRFAIPDSWLIYSGHDFGAVNSCAVFLAVDPASSNIWVWHEYKPDKANSVYDRVQEFKRIVGERKLVKAVGGSHQEEETRQAYGAHGWPILEPASHLQKVLTQVDRVRDLYERRRVYVFSDLNGTLNDIRNCLWKLGPDNKPTREILNEAHFHYAAGLRYILSDFRPETTRWSNIEPVSRMVRI